MDKIDFQSSELLLDIVRSEYQNEISRTSVIDTKVGITLPVIATYFFLVLQFDSLKEIFTSQLNTQNIGTVLLSVCKPLIYVSTIACAGIALIYLFRAIITHSYKNIYSNEFNTKYIMSQPKNDFSAVMVTVYIRAIEHNYLTNNTRVALYKKGWNFAMISLGLFVFYNLLTS